ncbi:MAG TPA: hypothetical protein VJ499_08640, partial [Flavisolibacter sp.]|nr:hypothetical protein [Flavisolibacter sp.]
SKNGGTSGGNPPPNPTTFSISGLEYDPHIVSLRPGLTSFTFFGKINFANAKSGVHLLRLTTSAGADFTQDIPANNESNGTLTGTFIVALTANPAIYTFDIWLIDGKGNASNKLSGTVQVIIDDSGKSWQETIISSTYQPNKIIWANSQFMAVGHAGIVITSNELSGWTLQQSGTNNMLWGVTWSGTQYVAVGENKTILTSPDGVHWTIRSIGDVSDFRLYGIVWSGSKFFAVGTNMANNQTEIQSSPDGIVWTACPFNVHGGELTSIAWSGNLLVAVGSYFIEGTRHPLLLTSPDGIDWTNKSSANTSGYSFNDVIWTGTKFVTVGSNVSGYSNDGINWSYASNPNMGLLGVCYSGKTYVAVGNGIFTSSDGMNWTQAYPDDHLYSIRSVAWSGYQYIAVGKVMSMLVSPGY